MVIGVARGIDDVQVAPGEVETVAIGGGDDAGFGYRRDLAVETVEGFVAIDGPRSLDQTGRIDQVPRAARMDDQFRLREGPHHCAGTAGVIQVYMGRHHESYLLRLAVERHQQGQGLLQAG